jgi:hypothetical protein
MEGREGGKEGTEGGREEDRHRMQWKGCRVWDQKSYLDSSSRSSLPQEFRGDILQLWAPSENFS